MDPKDRPALIRALYASLGVLLLGVGIVGFIVPGLPGTVFLLIAAWLFSMSSQRLYDWTTTNKWFGQSVADYRAGLGIRRRIKVISVTAMVLVCSYSAFFAIDNLAVSILVLALGAYGIWFVLTRPTRELIDPTA